MSLRSKDFDGFFVGWSDVLHLFDGSFFFFSNASAVIGSGKSRRGIPESTRQRFDLDGVITWHRKNRCKRLELPDPIPSFSEEKVGASELIPYFL